MVSLYIGIYSIIFVLLLPNPWDIIEITTVTVSGLFTF